MFTYTFGSTLLIRLNWLTICMAQFICTSLSMNLQKNKGINYICVTNIPYCDQTGYSNCVQSIFDAANFGHIFICLSFVNYSSYYGFSTSSNTIFQWLASSLNSWRISRDHGIAWIKKSPGSNEKLQQPPWALMKRRWTAQVADGMYVASCAALIENRPLPF